MLNTFSPRMFLLQNTSTHELIEFAVQVFNQHWRQAHEAGFVSGVGTSEYDACLRLWAQMALPHCVDTFIMELVKRKRPEVVVKVPAS